MTDYFALLGVPRRPWLDAESLKGKFHKLSAEHHPDVAKSGEVDFSAINAAFTALLDPRTRIKHLLDLEFPGAETASQIPAGIVELFEPIARGRSAATAFLKKRASLETPLEIALLAPEKIGLLATMQSLETTLVQKHEDVLARLKSLDEIWPQPGDAAPLQAVYQSLSYLGKWLAQVEEDLLRLREA